MTVVADTTVVFDADDGWPITGTLTRASEGDGAAVLLVPGSRHERDAYGTTLPRLLTDRGKSVLRIDIRGRGASAEPTLFAEMAPRQRADVRLDVSAAIEHLSARVGATRVGLVAEHDSATAASLASTTAGVSACVFVSGRLSQAAMTALAASPAPRLCLVSKDDRVGFRAMVDAYANSPNPSSRLVVFDGVGTGTTMFSAWQFAHPDQPPIEALIADWLAEVLRP